MRPNRKVVNLGEKIIEEPKTKVVSQEYYS